MKKLLIATAISIVFAATAATGALAQATPAAPANPNGVMPATPAIPATPALPAANAPGQNVAAVVEIIGNLEAEVAEFDALATVDASLVTLVDIRGLTPGNNSRALDAALEGTNPAALHELLKADPAVVAVFAAAEVDVESVVAIDVAANGAIVIYYDSEG